MSTDQCGYPGCSVTRNRHLARVIPADIRPHEFEQPRPITPASPEAIARVRPSSFKPRQENAS